MFHRNGKHPVRRNLFRVLLLAVAAMLAGWLAALAGWTWGSSVPPGAASIEALRERYPAAVTRMDSYQMSGFGPALVNRVNAYVSAVVIDALPPAESTFELHTMEALGDLMARFPESQAGVLTSGKRTLRLAAWRIRIEEIVFQKMSEAEDPRFLAAGREIWITADVTSFSTLPVFEPGARIVAGLHVGLDASGEAEYTFPLAGAFYRVPDDRVMTAAEEGDPPSLCDGVPYDKLRERLLVAHAAVPAVGMWHFGTERQLTDALDDEGGIMAPPTLDSLQALAIRTGLRESGWFRPGFLPEEVPVNAIVLRCLPDMATAIWSRSGADAVPDGWGGMVSWNLDEADSEALLAFRIRRDGMTESEVPGVYIGRESEAGFTAAWIQYGHCFWIWFPSGFDRAEAPSCCDMEPAALP